MKSLALILIVSTNVEPMNDACAFFFCFSSWRIDNFSCRDFLSHITSESAKHKLTLMYDPIRRKTE